MQIAQLVIKLHRLSLQKSNENFKKLIQTSRMLEDLENYDLGYYPKIFESFLNAKILNPEYEKILTSAYFQKLSIPNNINEKSKKYHYKKKITIIKK